MSAESGQGNEGDKPRISGRGRFNREFRDELREKALGARYPHLGFAAAIESARSKNEDFLISGSEELDLSMLKGAELPFKKGKIMLADTYGSGPTASVIFMISESLNSKEEDAIEIEMTRVGDEYMFDVVKNGQGKGILNQEQIERIFLSIPEGDRQKLAEYMGIDLRTTEANVKGARGGVRGVLAKFFKRSKKKK